jgi:adenylosuccinate lyase
VENFNLTAISPLDGRYSEKVQALRPIFSEYGLIRFRVIVEIRWLQILEKHAQLPELPRLSARGQVILNDIIENFSEQDAARIKHIEAGINHDVKAIEYFIKEHIEGNKELGPISEFIHFGCTSEDINNLSYALMLNTARQQCLLPSLSELIHELQHFAQHYAEMPMLARTHGQPATPTSVGKEMANFVARLKRQMEQLVATPILGKLNGASGNYNALACAYPQADWQTISKNFVNQLGLVWNPYTTQIEPHDYIAEFFGILARINTILIDLCRDMWGYIALNYFKQKAYSNEVGSSVMPHKVNPIDFENAEGNLGIANALFDHMSAKLPISRWQRDLSDSTVLRNMGVAMGHALLAYQSTIRGIQKTVPNEECIRADLNKHWEVLAEPVQTLMRRFGIEQPYEKLKALTRGQPVTQELLHQFIQEQVLPDEIKQQLLALTPENYLGYAADLAKRI